MNLKILFFLCLDIFKFFCKDTKNLIKVISISKKNVF